MKNESIPAGVGEKKKNKTTNDAYEHVLCNIKAKIMFHRTKHNKSIKQTKTIPMAN